MDTTPFVIERTYNAPADKVWSAITEPAKMKVWYFDMVGFEPKIGCEFTFTGHNAAINKTYIHLCKIVALEPLKKLVYTWRYEGFPGNSTVSFELFDEDGKTKLILTHEGIETFKGDIYPELAKENFVGGWNSLIGKSLPNYLENN